ncbi:uncharacterized protein DSM5745_01183 [Aspergillus mulundensis]|uniref:Uncharacterized protein n=1 Tax=Aspergillus mulundensis TaxID=1810919 RepID=A0A3D8T5Z7_9EURO|nr:hypothetical protein DSM5745_01183 [Aspergillus mulundensis]RDW93861.1 hypothetical protein DSM5745_01183 [Aspergillus mulundensis]
MKLKSSVSTLLGSLFFLSLSCVVTSAFVFDSLLRGLHQNIFARSLPGSLAFVPEEAIGRYQPPPGPIQYDPIPANNPNIPDAPAMASTAGDPGDDELGFGSRAAMAATESQADSEEAKTHIPSASEMDAMIAKAQTASASKKVVRSLAGLGASMLVSFLHS